MFVVVNLLFKSLVGLITHTILLTFAFAFLKIICSQICVKIKSSEFSEMNRWYIFESKIIISRVENSFTLIFSNTNFSCFSDWASARTRENCGAAPGENLLCTRIHVRKHEHYTRFYHKGGWGLGESSRGV